MVAWEAASFLDWMVPLFELCRQQYIISQWAGILGFGEILPAQHGHHGTYAKAV